VDVDVDVVVDVDVDADVDDPSVCAESTAVSSLGPDPVLDASTVPDSEKHDADSTSPATTTRRSPMELAVCGARLRMSRCRQNAGRSCVDPTIPPGWCKPGVTG
jgi:hypothetical protein